MKAMQVSSVLFAVVCKAVFAEYPPPPYSAVWNSPTTQCFEKSLDLSRFHIVQNRDDAINGGNITLFQKLGQFPVWGILNKTIVNGGIPQLGNLTLHLDVAKQDIVSLIPDANFTGLAVIDFHSWKPLYQQNFGELEIYKTESRAYTQKRYPNLNGTKLEKQAKMDFDEAARSFLEGTLQLALELRPHGLWGYLGYPYCYGVLGYYCDDMAVQENMEIQWLFEASGALYPSLFLSAL
jgi:hyaluronoglucosaminidase